MTNINFHQTVHPPSLPLCSVCVHFFLFAFPPLQALGHSGPSFTATTGLFVDARFKKKRMSSGVFLLSGVRGEGFRFIRLLFFRCNRVVVLIQFTWVYRLVDLHCVSKPTFIFCQPIGCYSCSFSLGDLWYIRQHLLDLEGWWKRSCFKGYKWRSVSYL